MSLASDAANFGRGGASGVLAAAGGAGNASSAGLSGVTGAAGATGGNSGVNTAFGLTGSGLGTNINAFTSRANTITQQPSALAGLGQLTGQLGSAAISRYTGSDRAIKKHTERIASLAHGIGLWLFHYLWDADDAPLRVGYMAHEVEAVFPEAVAVGPGGYKMVDYSMVAV
jgi:hypothetical protein